MINELSIIIPTYNEEKYITKLLYSIAHQNYSGKLEIIIIDGNSKDKTVKVAKAFNRTIPNLSIIVLHKRGIGYQRNLGAKKARYTYLLFLDADMILPPFYLTRFTNQLNHLKSFVATTCFWIAEKDRVSKFIYVILFPLILIIMHRERIIPGFILLTTKENHKKIRGFREDLLVAEDIDYGWSSIKNGATFRFLYLPIAFYSARRMRKRGRLKFWYDYLRGYIAIKKFGIEAAGKKIVYPYGQF